MYKSWTGQGGKDRDRARTERIKEQTVTGQSKELSLHRLDKMRKAVMKPDRIVCAEAKVRVVDILRTVYNYCFYSSISNSHLPHYENCLVCMDVCRFYDGEFIFFRKHDN
jgi:hypothetical protein